MSERPTPRTDKAEYEVRLGRSQWKRMVVRPELARQLERELAEAREERDRLVQVIEAARAVLIAAKGRRNTMLAYERLVAALAAVKDSGNTTDQPR